MNKIKAIALGVFIFALLACEQPFKAGLGPVVDVRDPTLTLTTPTAGSPIWGNMKFKGTAEDDYILSKVEIKVTNRPEAKDDKGRPYLQEYTSVTLNKTRQNVGNWEYELQTKLNNDDPIFPEGDIKIKLKVTDSVGKWSETDEIVFIVKNNPPAISITSPYIARGLKDGDVGGDHLNYYSDPARSPDDLPVAISYGRRVDKDSPLTGSISDAQGIYTGEKVGNLFPPQIRFWRVNDMSNALDQEGFRPGLLPSEAQVPWEDFIMTGADANLLPLALSNEGDMTYGQFAYKLPDDPGHFYGFQVRAQSVDHDTTEFHYPLDYYNMDNNTPSHFVKENSYVLIYITARQAPPTVELIAFEDILNPGSWNPGDNRYNNIPGVDDNEYHKYLNKTTVNNKNGPFTLRVKAAHGQGINSAEVYWIKEEGTNSGDRGRFIWDLANETPKNAGGTAVAGWESANNVAADRPYSQWGYRDQNSAVGGIYSRRNFIFTYEHDGNDRVPSSGIHEAVAGQPKIQKYKGTSWDDRKTGNWSLEDVFDASKWESAKYDLEEGVYRIEVWARSSVGTGMTQPLECYVRIDWTRPEVEFTAFDGAYGEATSSDIELFKDTPGNLEANDLIVNGVIQTRMRFSDSRAEDSGLRGASLDDKYYNYISGGSTLAGYEQRYLLVKDGDDVQMDKLIAYSNVDKAGTNNWWPDVPVGIVMPDESVVFNDPVIPEIAKIYKHGPIRNSKFFFKTSPIYPSRIPAEDDTLADGSYWLYVFARDNAFNVGSKKQKIVVKAASDKPRFDYSLTEIKNEVESPHPGADGTTGFWLGTGDARILRNGLGQSQNIQIRLTDDDSLDLGTASDPSKVTISFTGTKQLANGNIVEGEPIELLVKEIFSPQGMTDDVRRSVLERTGTIRQETLLNLLKAESSYDYLFTNTGGKASYTSLPDGIYKLKIDIADYAPAKLTMPDTDTDPAEVAVNDTTLWFVVDNTAPQIVGTILPDTTFPGATALLAGVKGTVSDRNGPITISYTVSNDGRTFIGPNTLTLSSLPPDEDLLDDGIWQVEFNIPVDIGARSGEFIVSLDIKDRFGRTSTKDLKYTVDNKPPTVDLRTRMVTVDRSGFTAPVLASNDLGTVPTGHLVRLANGVVSFVVRAIDDSAVAEVRWWLLPASVTTTPNFNSYVKYEDGVFDSFELKENGSDIIGKAGRFTSNFNSTTFYIDTADLTQKTVYNLYAIAVDVGGNYSTDAPPPVTPLMQTIYVIKESDNPFFGGNIVPADGATVESAVLRGTIYEDDGFFAANNDIRDDSIRIWMGTASTGYEPNGQPKAAFTEALKAELEDEPLDNFSDFGYTETVSIDPKAKSVTGLNPPENLSKQGNNINMAINLAASDYFRDLFHDGTKSIEGMKYYIIEARDSSQGKVNADGTPSSERVFRRMAYSFMYDTLPPSIEVEYPLRDGSSAFNGANVSFQLRGWMKDANLDKTANQVNPANNGKYYFRYKFNDETGEGATFILYDDEIGGSEAWIDLPAPPSPPVTSSPPSVDANGETWVYFKISDTRVKNEILQYATIKSGSNTLWLTVRDTSGKEETFGVKFFIDQDGPYIFPNFQEVKLEEVTDYLKGLTPPITFSNWWTAPAGDAAIQAWYQNRRDYLNAYKEETNKEVPVIPRAGTEPVTLSGTFEDDSSFVENSFKYLFDRTVGPTDKDSTYWSAPVAITAANGGGVSKSARWSVNIPDTGTDRLEDGLHSIQLIAYDVQGNYRISGTFAFRIASGQPTVALTMGSIPTVIGNKTGTVFVASGSAESPNLAEVNLLIRHTDRTINSTNSFSSKLVDSVSNPNSGNIIQNDWSFTVVDDKKVTEKLTWELNVTRADIEKAGGGAYREGVYELIVVSVDLDGAESEEKIWTFTIDTTKPKFTFTGLYPSNNGSISPYNEDLLAKNPVDKTLTGENPKVQASIEDDLSNLTVVQRQLRKYSYTANSGAGGWDTVIDWQNVQAGAINSQYLAMDWDLKTSLIGMSDGFYSIRLRAVDSAIIGTATSWDTTPAGDGNPVESDYLYFFYASKAPDIQHEDLATTLFSTRNEDGNRVTLEITVTDENRFNTLTVKVENPDGTELSPKPVITMPENGLAEKLSNTWGPSISIAFPPRRNSAGTSVINANGYEDGKYRIIFTVTDLAGRETEVDRTITLDNTAPKGAIAEPRQVTVNDSYPYASEIKIGGEELTISGTTDDINGVAEIWFHLGYGHVNTSTTTNRKEFPTQTQVAGYFGEDESAWFKYTDGVPGGVSGSPPVPGIPYFSNITNSSFPYTWSLTMTSDAIAAYVKEIEVKGTTYRVPNDTDGPWMVQPIDESRIPESFHRDKGLYSLPLWIRVVDSVGNISYSERDIWIYPNGDYPTSTILNPAEAGADRPKGGLINVDGLAIDNLSVRKVIYRVKTDNYRNLSDPEGSETVIRTFPGDSERLLANNSAERTRMETVYKDTINAGASALLGDGWYEAILGTSGQSVPWSFTLNANNEITSLIDSYGFDSLNNGIKDMIRVRVEVLVFDEKEGDYHMVSLGGSGNVPGQAKPYVRTFYLNKSAPTIENQKLSIINAPDFTAEGSFGDHLAQVRRGQFAIRADLKSNSSLAIGQIQVRLQQELAPGTGQYDERNWMTVYRTGTAPDYDLTRTLAGLNFGTLTASSTTATLTWRFDSVTNNSASNPSYKRVRNEGWNITGGRYTIDVRVRDTSGGEAQYTFDLGIDNFAPYADSANPMTRTPRKVAGSNVAFIGRVFDYTGTPATATPPYRGIEKVTAWFTQGVGAVSNTTNYINLTTPTTTTAQLGNQGGLTTMQNVWTGREANTGTSESISSVTLRTPGTQQPRSYPTSAAYLKVISESTAGPGSNMTWQPNGEHDILWNFIANTRAMPDGRITMHYLVQDKAGNVSYYYQEMIVMNNYPVITQVNLSTNNTGVGAIFENTEEGKNTISGPYAEGYLDSGFISKNSNIGFAITTAGGNGTLTYRVRYVERIPITLTTANLALMAGKTYTGTIPNTIGNTGVYTIRDKGNVGDNDWATLGTHTSSPPVGTNFVFQATPAEVAGLNYTGTVWGYRVINNNIVETTTTGTGGTANLSFINTPTNTTYFGPDGNRLYNDLTGNTFFLIEVYDNLDTGNNNEDEKLYDAVVVGMSVFVSDVTPPTARLYDLNPYVETAVVRNNADTDALSATKDAAAAPTAIGANILRGGLFNVKTERDMVKSGYIDPRNNTTALRPEIQDPDIPTSWRATDADGFVTGDLATGGPTNDKVSGTVILRGVVNDDQYVRDIRIKIGDDPEKTILRLTNIVTGGTTVREMKPVDNAPAYAYEEINAKTGHTVEWAYIWDTHSEPASASGAYQNGIQITVSASDRRDDDNNNLASGTVTADNTATRTYHNRVTVDIVPYVVGFERQSQYATTRSRQGWYSFFQGETNIALLGYNLGNTTTGNVPTIRYATGTGDNAGTTMGTVATAFDNNRLIFPRRYTFGIPTDAVSGKINVTANRADVTPATTMAAHNNTFTTDNYTNRSWNREDNAYISGSDLWINRPHAHILRTTENATAPRTYFYGSNGPTSPGMTIEYDTTTAADRGRLHAAWTSFGDATFYYGNNGGDNRTPMKVAPTGDPFAETDISMYNGTGTPNMSAVYQNDGAPYVLLRTTMTTAGDANNQEHRNARISASLVANNTDNPTAANSRATERWRNTRIAKAAANFANNVDDPYVAPDNAQNTNLNLGENNFRANRVYMTAYDSQGKYLWFGMRYNNNNTAGNNSHDNYTRIIDGNRTSATATVQGNMDRTDAISTAADTSSSAGEFSAVDFDSTGPIVAYYDAQNETVRIAVGTLATTGTNLDIASWTRRNLLPDDHPLFQGSGKYISMKMDKGGGVHLAFYNSTYQTVVYAFMASKTTAAASVVAYTIDNVIQGGTWTDISVDNTGIPMIVYGNISRMGNYDGVRIAYRSGTTSGIQFTRALTCPVTGTSIANWEALSMPANYTVKNDRLNVEVWPPNTNVTVGNRPTGITWNAAVGYASDMYRIGYFYYPAYKGY